MLTIELTEILTKEFNPKFLNYDVFDSNINIVISSNCFINQPIAERVRSIYSCIEKNLPEAFETHRVFVHTFTQEELKEVLKTYSEEGTE
jgi:stress-induced morphogen